MINKIRFAFNYLKYFLFGQTKHDIHSPFIFNLLTNVIEDTTPYYIFKPIEMLREKLLVSKKAITITDLGAGSSINPSRQRKIADITKHSAKPAKYGQLLFRLINHFKPEKILELGTSLGISSLYLATPNSNARIVTLEGCPETAAVAQNNFNILKIKNIELSIGDFKKTLPDAVHSLKKLDAVFFDGNHQKEATLNYFEQCLPFTTNNSLFIFDDIYWSKGMEEAWKTIKNHPKVIVTVDLFFIGLVFFRSEQKKQHFKLKF